MKDSTTKRGSVSTIYNRILDFSNSNMGNIGLTLCLLCGFVRPGEVVHTGTPSFQMQVHRNERETISQGTRNLIERCAPVFELGIEQKVNHGSGNRTKL